MVDVARRARHAAFAVAAATPVIAIVVLGWWNRFLADDYAIGYRLKQLGFVGSWTDQLGDLNGRFAGYFISDTLALLGPHGAWFATVLAMVAFVAAVYLALPGDDDDENEHERWSPRRAVAALVLVGAVIVATPAYDQAFLWVSGVGMVTASLIACAFAVAFARRAALATQRVQARAAWFAATFLAAFLASGAYETTAFVLMVGGAVAAAAIGWRHRWALAAAGTIAAGAAAGLLTVAAIPGSRIRRTYFPNGKPVPDAVDEGVRVAVSLARDALGTRPVLLAFVAGVLCAAPALSRWRAARCFAAVVAGALAIVTATIAFSVWVFGTMPPTRTMGVPAAVFVTAAFVVGWLVPAPRSWTPWLAAGVCCLTVYASLPLFDLVPERRAWAADWDRRESLLLRASSDDVVEVPRLWAPDGLDDIAADPAFWVNEVAAGYYGVRQVVGVPLKDYPGCWASMTRKGSTSCGSPSTSTITP